MIKLKECKETLKRKWLTMLRKPGGSCALLLRCPAGKWVPQKCCGACAFVFCPQHWAWHTQMPKQLNGSWEVQPQGYNRVSRVSGSAEERWGKRTATFLVSTWLDPSSWNWGTGSQFFSWSSRVTCCVRTPNTRLKTGSYGGGPGAFIAPDFQKTVNKILREIK